MSLQRGGQSLRHLLQHINGSGILNRHSSRHGVQFLDSSQAQIIGGSGSSSSSSSGRCTCRAFSDYASPGRSAAGTGLRRVNVSGRTTSGSSAAEGAASTSGEASSSSSSLLSEMKEVPGGSKPLRKWEYYYWGLGATGMAFFLYTRLKKPEKTPEEIQEAERKFEELRARRKDHVRAVLMSQNFLLGEDDPLDGLSPAQIVLFCEKYGIDPTDPLEGLTPEEIDVYMAQQEANKQQEASHESES